MPSKTIYTATILVAMTIVGGCASTAEIDALRDELRSEIDQANQTAQSAAADADSAKSLAAEAKAIAEEAKVSADEANSKIDNMFKKSMYK